MPPEIDAVPGIDHQPRMAICFGKHRIQFQLIRPSIHCTESNEAARIIRIEPANSPCRKKKLTFQPENNFFNDKRKRNSNKGKHAGCQEEDIRAKLRPPGKQHIRNAHEVYKAN